MPGVNYVSVSEIWGRNDEKEETQTIYVASVAGTSLEINLFTFFFCLGSDPLGLYSVPVKAPPPSIVVSETSVPLDPNRVESGV